MAASGNCNCVWLKKIIEVERKWLHYRSMKFLDGTIDCTEDEPKKLCEAQYELFQSIFTWFLLTNPVGTFLLDLIHKRFGTFTTRILLGTLTMSGLILLVFYEGNNYLIVGAWQLIGLPAPMYMIINIKGLIS